MQWSFSWEDSFLLFLQEAVRIPWLNVLMRMVTKLGDAGIAALLTCLVLLCIPAYRRIGRIAVLSLILDLLLLNLFLKNIIARVRPYVAIEGLIPIAKLPSDWSFPSGHTGATFAVASVLFLVSFWPHLAGGGIPSKSKEKDLPRWIGILALILAFLVSFSRLYLGVHYPTDVLAGLVIGWSTGLAAVWIHIRFFQK